MDKEMLFSDDIGIASILNRPFSKVFTKENTQQIPAPTRTSQGANEQLGVTEICASEGRKYLQNMNPN